MTAEGTWFAVPLDSGGFGVGIVARLSRRHNSVPLGYFFGPQRAAVPRIGEVRTLSPGAAILVSRFSDLDLRAGQWPIIGRGEGWSRERWPVPVFLRQPPIGSARLVFYDDDNHEVADVRVADGQDTEGLPVDGMAGAGYLTYTLDQAIAQGDPPVRLATPEDL